MKIRLNDLLKGTHLFARELQEQNKAEVSWVPWPAFHASLRHSPLAGVSLRSPLCLSELHYISRPTSKTSLESIAWPEFPPYRADFRLFSSIPIIHNSISIQSKMFHHIVLWLTNFASLFFHTLWILWIKWSLIHLYTSHIPKNLLNKRHTISKYRCTSDL